MNEVLRLSSSQFVRSLVHKHSNNDLSNYVILKLKQTNDNWRKGIFQVHLLHHMQWLYMWIRLAFILLQGLFFIAVISYSIRNSISSHTTGIVSANQRIRVDMWGVGRWDWGKIRVSKIIRKLFCWWWFYYLIKINIRHWKAVIYNQAYFISSASESIVGFRFLFFSSEHNILFSLWNDKNT